MNISDRTQKILESLKSTASKTLEHKRRLGQYAVVWQNDKPVAIGEDAPPDVEKMSFSRKKDN